MFIYYQFNRLLTCNQLQELLDYLLALEPTREDGPTHELVCLMKSLYVMKHLSEMEINFWVPTVTKRILI